MRIFRINLTSHEAVDLGVGEVSANDNVVRAEPGNSVLLSRTVNGLTNIWKYSLKDRSLRQVTFGTGPDYSPMPDPGGKGIYFVNGKSSEFLTAYYIQSTQSTDIVSDATDPAISPDGNHVMYITLPASQRSELWTSNIDGGNKVKVATGESLGTGSWARDNFHLSFMEEADSGNTRRAYIIGADGTGLQQSPPMPTTLIGSAIWSPDQKSIYLSVMRKKYLPTYEIWKWDVDGSNSEKLVADCSLATDAHPGGKYLLGAISFGERTGIVEASISNRKCTPLLPGVVTSAATFDRDGKSFLYAVASHGQVTIYRQTWSNGKTIGTPQVALKVPFAFPLTYRGGKAYDLARDLSTIVYARPGGHADLYLLNQK